MKKRAGGNTGPFIFLFLENQAAWELVLPFVFSVSNA